MKTVVIVILDKFADWEAAYISSALAKEVGEGHRVVYASTDLEPKTSIGGLRALPQVTLAQAPRDALGVIFIGAEGSWRQEQKEAEQLARQFADNGKVVAAICDAARWLAGTGLINHAKHTANSLSELQELPNYTHAAGFVYEDAVRDGQFVTANGNAPVAFAGQVLRTLAAAPEEQIQMYEDFHTLGFYNAMKKYGYL